MVRFLTLRLTYIYKKSVAWVSYVTSPVGWVPLSLLVCLVSSGIMKIVDHYAFLFNCTMVVRVSDNETFL